MKTCTGCGVRQPIEEFYRANGYVGGRQTGCRSCMKTITTRTQQRLASRTPEEMAASLDRLRPDGVKTCSICGHSKGVDFFGANKRAPDGLRCQCKSCVNERRNPDHVKEFKVRHRAKLGYYSKLEALGGMCWYCRARDATTIDHMVPVSRGGSDTDINTVPSCQRCNSQKNSRTPMEFMLWKVEKEMVL